ncbi:hypothetical protein [Burkholderia sp. BCC1998]|uniref:hypothetical protein n=1 Tax=Burkholderia sp. BCC1998 TaxID=2817447 RepID=UPI002AB7C00D|nr:hypothetical protein [Burkholderia sp. BCC1998]
MALEVLQQVLGHASLQTTTIYVNAEQQQMRQEAAKYYARLAARRGESRLCVVPSSHDRSSGRRGAQVGKRGDGDPGRREARSRRVEQSNSVTPESLWIKAFGPRVDDFIYGRFKIMSSIRLRPH